jgi:hypothetical protein
MNNTCVLFACSNRNAKLELFQGFCSLSIIVYHVQASPTKLLKDSMMKAAEDRNGGASKTKAAEVSNNNKMADQIREMSQIAGDNLRDHSLLLLRHPDVGIHHTKWANREVTKGSYTCLCCYVWF